MNTQEIKPTDSELEILQVIWSKGEATVREVHDLLSDKKDVGYTTTLKIMQIMHIKGILSRNTDSKSHLYEAALSKEKTQKLLVNKLVETLFEGSATDLISYVLSSRKASKKDLEQLRKQLKQMEKKGK